MLWEQGSGREGFVLFVVDCLVFVIFMHGIEVWRGGWGLGMHTM